MGHHRYVPSHVRRLKSTAIRTAAAGAPKWRNGVPTS
jgi:hypothetical protein